MVGYSGHYIRRFNTASLAFKRTIEDRGQWRAIEELTLLHGDGPEAAAKKQKSRDVKGVRARPERRPMNAVTEARNEAFERLRCCAVVRSPSL